MLPLISDTLYFFKMDLICRLYNYLCRVITYIVLTPSRPVGSAFHSSEVKTTSAFHSSLPLVLFTGYFQTDLVSLEQRVKSTSENRRGCCVSVVPVFVRLVYFFPISIFKFLEKCDFLTSPHNYYDQRVKSTSDFKK